MYKSEKYIYEFYKGSGENAPEFIYRILYGKTSPKFRGKINPELKDYKGIMIDKKLPLSIIDKLNKIKNVEIRSTCQGHSPDRPTYVILRLPGRDKEGVKKFVGCMNKQKDIKCSYGTGNQGQYRIGITWALYYEQDIKKFEAWWKDLPNKILRCLK